MRRVPRPASPSEPGSQRRRRKQEAPSPLPPECACVPGLNLSATLIPLSLVKVARRTLTEEEEEQDEEERKEPDAPDAPAREVEEKVEEEEEEENEELPMPRLRTKSLKCVVCGRPGSPAKIVVPIIHIGNGPALKVCKKAHLRDSNERKAVLAAIREQIEEAREEAVEEEEDAGQRRCHGYGRLGAEGSRCGARVGQGGPLLWVLKSHRETLKLYFCNPAHLCNYIDQEYRLPPRNNGKKEKKEKEKDKEETDVETGDEGN